MHKRLTQLYYLKISQNYKIWPFQFVLVIFFLDAHTLQYSFCNIYRWMHQRIMWSKQLLANTPYPHSEGLEKSWEHLQQRQRWARWSATGELFASWKCSTLKQTSMLSRLILHQTPNFTWTEHIEQISDLTWHGRNYHEEHTCGKPMIVMIVLQKPYQ